MRINVYSKDGSIVGKRKLSPSVFEQEINKTLISEVIRAYMANAREGTASAKKRGEVRGGGRKPWRQKHTGMARAGSTRSPIWRGGGVTFGPKPRDYNIDMPKKKKRLALLSSLSLMAKNGKILIIDEITIEHPKTKIFYDMLKTFGVKESTKLLFTLEKTNTNVYKSGRNIPGVSFITASDLNALAVLSADTIIFSLKGLLSLEERLG
ncbi:MAG: 50S ribosomal protein L4 [candidate division WOR-3 bacterium]|nr:50S ribosomal protein L4 [candidate division WOR-3 bacterium]